MNEVQNMGKERRLRSQQFFYAIYVEKRFTSTYREYEDAMLVPIWMGTNMAAQNQQKYRSLSFATSARILSLEALKNIKNNTLATFLTHMTAHCAGKGQ